MFIKNKCKEFVVGLAGEYTLRDAKRNYLDSSSHSGEINEYTSNRCKTTSFLKKKKKIVLDDQTIIIDITNSDTFVFSEVDIKNIKLKRQILKVRI